MIAGLNAVQLNNIKQRKEAADAMAQHIVEPGVIQFLLRSLYKNNDGQFAWRFNLNLIQRDYQRISIGIDDTLSFSGPTLFIKGGNSNYILAEHQDLIKSLFPEAQAKIIQGVGHWLHAEKPTIFAKLVRDFLNK